jgi:hypothetical protein
LLALFTGPIITDIDRAILRNEAKRNEFIFIIGTNYYDRIDSAAKRSGRFDQTFPIVYPDLESRASILLGHLLRFLGSPNALRGYLALMKEISDDTSFLDTLAKFTGLVSYNGLQDFNRYLTNLTSRNREQINDDSHRQYAKEGYRDIVGEVKKYNTRQVSAVLKSEIDLVEYYRRRPNAMEEIEAVLQVLPTTKFLWGARSKLNRLDILGELVAAVESEEQLDHKTKQQFVQKMKSYGEQIEAPSQ